MTSASAEQIPRIVFTSIMEVSQRSRPDPVVPLLTPRQTDCIKLVERGLTSKQIARELGISPRTVEQHIAAVLETLQVNNRMAAVMMLRDMAAESERRTAPFKLNDLSDGDCLTAVFISPDLYPSKAKLSKARILPQLGGRTNSESLPQRLAWIIRIALLASMLSCFLLLSILGVSNLAELSGL